MKKFLLISLAALIFTLLPLSAQLPYMQFSHDTLGNRTGRVYGTTGGILPLLSPDGTALQSRWWMDEDVDVFTGRNAFTQQTNDAASRHGRLIKTQKEKEEYDELLRKELEALMPISSSRSGVRDVTSYDVGEIPLATGLLVLIQVKVGGGNLVISI